MFLFCCAVYLFIVLAWESSLYQFLIVSLLTIYHHWRDIGIVPVVGIAAFTIYCLALLFNLLVESYALFFIIATMLLVAPNPNFLILDDDDDEDDTLELEVETSKLIEKQKQNGNTPEVQRDEMEDSTSERESGTDVVEQDQVAAEDNENGDHAESDDEVKEDDVEDKEEIQIETIMTSPSKRSLIISTSPLPSGRALAKSPEGGPAPGLEQIQSSSAASQTSTSSCCTDTIKCTTIRPKDPACSEQDYEQVSRMSLTAERGASAELEEEDNAQTALEYASFPRQTQDSLAKELRRRRIFADLSPVLSSEN